MIELPDTISKLKKLESLLLVFNYLERLPDTIGALASLHMLLIGNNRIRSLPRRFGQLRNLDWGLRHMSSSVIDGNPIERPPMDVCKQGVEAIANYFASETTNANTSPKSTRRRR